ncbi:ABC-type lipoprotein export system ATPase subunit [Natronobacillus azotifigens]|uniref:ABC transporter ATP-binding protein n=1 Tax=Natronobacillus azotifigens TaxID=472978 RepID=A0A9J6R8E3_9BACI|nr:ABC transporter ATP-binding protein [Natronobacillus azotifigens]MCZ0701930.1 ABC transporter ATP-binding protein [Natronobacillus azotifigens]
MNIQLNNVKKSYQTEQETIHVLKNVNVELESGCWLTITGPSGSGKTTLMRCLSGLESVDQGSILLGDFEMSKEKEEKTRAFRREHIGYVFQDFQLFDQFNLLTNVMVPLLPYEKKSVIEQKAKQLIEQFGLSERMYHKPSQLSGGEKQRTAIVRALMNDPKLLICDEPTGNLDVNSRDQTMKVLKDIQQQGVTIILVTHDLELTSYSDVHAMMRDGQVNFSSLSYA